MTATPSQTLRSHSGATYFEMLGRHIVTWIVMGVVAVCMCCFGFLRWHVPALIGTFALLGSCIALGPLAMKAIYAILLGWSHDVPAFLRQDQSSPEWQCWFEKQFERFSSSPAAVYFGAIYAVFSVAAFWLGGAFTGLSSFMLVICFAIAAIASFVCGVGLAAIFYLARLIWDVGSQYQVRVSEHSYGVLSTGKMLVKAYALVAVVWCLYTGSAASHLRGKLIPLLALAVPAVIFFIGSFLISQFPLRRRMVECKRSALLELDKLLESLTPKQPSDVTEERQRQMNFYVSEMHRIQKWPEWPFSIGNLSGLMGATLGAVAPALIRIVLPLIAKQLS
jgi:hypothetical protein